VGIVVWGTAAMRTQEDDIGEVLALLGVRPVWQAESRRVTGIEVIPLAELGRPRIDVTPRISGFFRDAFPNLVHLVDEAIRTVAELDEPPEQNFVRKHALAARATYTAAGGPEAAARTRSLYRILARNPGPMGLASCRSSTSATGAVTRISPRSIRYGAGTPIVAKRTGQRPPRSSKRVLPRSSLP
jgi:cobaltochelatase CobN